MARNIFAAAFATLLVAAFAGTSQAAPIAPLPSSVSQDSAITPVGYYHHYRYWHRRHCWRGYYGRLHCRW
jgi:type IV secretory pathway protease TraF